MPASTARPRSPRNKARARSVAGSTPSAPYLATRSGARGGDSGESSESTSPKPPRAAAPALCRQARASRAEPRPAAVRETSLCTSTASWPSSGCAACTCGNAHSTGSRRPRKAAEAMASGSTVAHMSWVYPSRVSAALRSPPPNSSAPSSSSTRSPASASVTAPISPFGPEPTTTASNPSAPATSPPLRPVLQHYTPAGSHRERGLPTPAAGAGTTSQLSRGPSRRRASIAAAWIASGTGDVACRAPGRSWLPRAAAASVAAGTHS